jgi:hypothetical protein
MSRPDPIWTWISVKSQDFLKTNPEELDGYW